MHALNAANANEPSSANSRPRARVICPRYAMLARDRQGAVERLAQLEAGSKADSGRPLARAHEARGEPRRELAVGALHRVCCELESLQADALGIQSHEREHAGLGHIWLNRH